MKFNSKLSFKPCLLAAAVAAQSLSFSAIAASSLSLEEVIVTAERRETSLQSTPAAITAITGEVMAATGIDDLNNLTLSLPGVQISGISSSQQQISMRGNVTEVRGAALAQSVGFFVDGLYFGRSNLFNQNLTDVERVEVLRGPQGTLWGHNIVGGSINVITKDPTEETEADMKVSMGNYDRIELSGRVAGPLTDNLLGQLSFSSANSDGYVTNLDSGQDLGGDDSQVLRAKLLWNVSDDLSVKFSATQQRDRSAMTPRNFFPGPGDATTGFVPPADIETQTFQRDRNGSNNNDTTILSLDINYVFENGMTFSSQTGNVDSDARAINFAFFPFPQEFGEFTRNDVILDESFTQEFRLASDADSRLFWQVGTYIYNNDSDFTENNTFLGNPGTLAGVLFPIANDLDNSGAVEVTGRGVAKTESQAVFGQATYEVSDWMNLTLGGRYTVVEKDFTGSAFGEFAAIVLTQPGGFSQKVSGEWDNFSPKVTADFHWDDVGIFDSLLTYTTYSEGWKEGGFTRGTSAAAQLADANEILPESAENSEIGFKTTMFDNRLTFNAALFHTEYTGQQTVVPDGVQQLVFNLDSEIDGVEIDGAFVATEWLTLNYAYAYYDAAYADDAAVAANGVPVPVGGNQTISTPETSYNLGWNTHWDLNSGAQVSFRGNYSFSSNVESDPDAPLATAAAAGRPELLDLTESEILNASLTYAKDNFEISLWGRNLTDDFTLTNAASFSAFWVNSAIPAGGPPNFVNPAIKSFEAVRTEPRAFGISAKWSL